MGKKALQRQLSDKEAAAKLKALRVSPRKLGLVAQSVVGLPVEQALVQLQFSTKRIAQDVRKLLLSAVANAENNHALDIDRLYVAEARVGKAFVMKRFSARARGRSARILKPFSHLEIIVREKKEEETN